jgi:hypothetical protein
VAVEFGTHEQNGLLFHTQNISLALALALIVVELEPSSSLNLPHIQCHFYPSS